MLYIRGPHVAAALIALCLSPLLSAAPTLTTIQDTLYKADGTLFSGFAFVEWKGFQVDGSSNVATQSAVVPIINGVLYVQLAPTTTVSPSAYYTVRYNSDGRIQFTETWVVPLSPVPLKLKDVRIAAPPPGSGGVIPPPVMTQVTIPDVIGLSEELAVRPPRGVGFAPSRAAVINSAGALESAVGNLADCVRVDGTSGPCGTPGSGPQFVDNETPAGLINGTNAVFTLADAPSPASSLTLFRNGVRQKENLDYQLAGNVITFLSSAIPSVGDVLLSSYRLDDPASPTGEASGALTGFYPSPSIAAEVITNLNISPNAAIAESKLALNFPTHSNANDPTTDQKAALAGTAGAPSTTNRYVTDQDSRLSNARMPLPHGLLGAEHGDTTAASPVRGDLIVAQGASPTTWRRLALGPANRCLMSNGVDAVWNTCLFTGFAAGSIPFVDSLGNLAQNTTRLSWDNTNRRLSIGTDQSLSTLYLYDSAPTVGSTGLTIRAGQGQGSSPLQRWLDSNGVELARMNAQGYFVGAGFQGASTPTRAAWRDPGTSTDPTSRNDGDTWHNSTENTRKSSESGQVHTSPQVICSSTGGATSSTALSLLGTCQIPGGLLRSGDRIDLRFDYSHAGAATSFLIEVRWSSSTILVRGGAASESRLSGRADLGITASNTDWSVQSWGSSLPLAVGAGTHNMGAELPVVVEILGQMDASTADTISLRNFTVIRYPAQANP
ncbi:MAG: hypothetical protein ACK5AZ_10505 [Bryobacteraceae bacterium]